MRDLRYLNLFERITNIRTRYCFEYNNTIIFCIPGKLISKALGPNARNIRRISEILRKRVKIIFLPRNLSDARNFIGSIVSPVMFKDLEITPEEIILTAGSQSKAALIGRNRRRLLEMQKIVRNFFKRDFKIV